MFVERTLYSLDDVTIIPAVTSNIRHRKEDVSILYKNETYYNDTDNALKECLPIFVSPMASVTNKENFDIWQKNKLISILPRTEKIEDRLEYSKKDLWAAYSLEEFIKYFCDDPIVKNIDDKDICIKALIDIANGHMSYIGDAIKKAKEVSKEFNYKLEIMAGNVANPETYKVLAFAGADYVRLSVGTGTACITSSNTGINYPMASLIDDTKAIKTTFNLTTKIVADGGINSYAKIIKALALGADYVMLGSTLAKCVESAAEIIYDNYLKTSKGLTFESVKQAVTYYETEESKRALIKDNRFIKLFFGMASHKAQELIQKAQGIDESEIKLKTSEGIVKNIPVEYTVNQWVENFEDYLRSNMSYCGITNINDYIGKPEVRLWSEAAKNSINK